MVIRLSDNLYGAISFFVVVVVVVVVVVNLLANSLARPTHTGQQ